MQGGDNQWYEPVTFFSCMCMIYMVLKNIYIFYICFSMSKISLNLISILLSLFYFISISIYFCFIILL